MGRTGRSGRYRTVMVAGSLIFMAGVLVLLALNLPIQPGGENYRRVTRPEDYNVARQPEFVAANATASPSQVAGSGRASSAKPTAVSPKASVAAGNPSNQVVGAKPPPEAEVLPSSGLGDYSTEALRQILSDDVRPGPGKGLNAQLNSQMPFDARYNPVAAPTIPFQIFQQVLAQGNSPALPEAAAMYDVCLRERCDPALALAFFDTESSLGTRGVAVQTKSLGNIRCKNNFCVSTDGNGAFQRYSSWTEGMEAWAVLLRDTYLAKWKLATIEEIVPRYAPGEQSINYVNSVKAKVDNLRLRGRLR